jgi:hypothetical protein
MDMIGHQHVSVDSKPMVTSGLAQLFEEGEAVAITPEDIAAIVSTQDHVRWNSGQK